MSDSPQLVPQTFTATMFAPGAIPLYVVPFAAIIPDTCVPCFVGYTSVASVSVVCPFGQQLDVQ